MIKKVFDFDCNLDKGLNYYKNNGFCIFKNVFNSNNLEKLIYKIENIVDYQLKDLEVKSKFKNLDEKIIFLAKKNDEYRKRLYETIQKLPHLMNLTSNKKLFKVVKNLNISFPLIRNPQIKKEFPKKKKIFIPSNSKKKNNKITYLVFFITAIKDISNLMGSIYISPKSFKLGPIEPTTSKKLNYQFIDKKKYQKKYPLKFFPLKQGETIMINMYAIHGSRENNSNIIRWSNIIRFEDAYNMPFLKLKDSYYKKFNLKG